MLKQTEREDKHSWGRGDLNRKKAAQLGMAQLRMGLAQLGAGCSLLEKEWLSCDGYGSVWEGCGSTGDGWLNWGRVAQLGMGGFSGLVVWMEMAQLGMGWLS